MDADTNTCVNSFSLNPQPRPENRTERETTLGSFHDTSECDVVITAKDKSNLDKSDDAVKNGKLLESPAMDISMVSTPLLDRCDQLYPHGCYSRFVARVEDKFDKLWRRLRRKVYIFIRIVACLLYLTYFGYCVQYRYFDEGSYVLTAVTVVLISVVCVRLTSGCKLDLLTKLYYTLHSLMKKILSFRFYIKIFLYLAVTITLCVYLGVSVISQSPKNVQALVGLFILVTICFLLSVSPSRVDWHPVFWGFVLQFSFAILTLRTEVGYEMFKWVGDHVTLFVRFSDSGAAFVFGDSFRNTRAGFFFESAGVIVFFNSCIFVLDYYGVLELVVLKLGRAISLCLNTGPVESVVSAANIFIGLSEAPLFIRPYLPTITKSELHAVMTCGFSSISGAFMAMFIKSGAPASHLLTAAIISAPAALAISKLMYPEMETVDLEKQKDIRARDESSPKTLVQAASDGAAFSTKLVAAIMVNMMAFVSILSLTNATLVWLGERAGVQGMTFDFLCSYLLYPVAFLMGIDSEDSGKIGSLMGVKFIATPFVAYADLGRMIKNRHVFESYASNSNASWYVSGEDVILTETNTTLYKGFMSERSEVITTYALCGISAFPAIGFCLGTLVPMCPKRKDEIISLVLRAFLAGNMTNYVTGAVAGIMFTS
ncbi:solute carrier family 28 member 3-like [Biomphalaria glabrata]|uniref:Solute carrier family 28 member 3-like n=1 Tax=Biomphalaria glabrata TaxID=6526 RepID=A0A9W2ZH35_BIOGL|nr:solute carrier family 28 member 3-like [Biomphalaria glabrata]